MNTSFKIMLFSLLLCSCYFHVERKVSDYEVFTANKSDLISALKSRRNSPLLRFHYLNTYKLPKDSVGEFYFRNKNNQDWFYQLKNRKIILKAEISDTILNGQYYTYHNNGDVRSIGHYKQGAKDGEWMQFHTNGIQINGGRFSSGKQVGRWHYYDTLKVARESRYYENHTNYSVTGYDSLDRKSFTGFVSNEKENKKWTQYDTLGEVTMEISYKDGFYHDSLILFKDGNKAAYQIFNMGNLVEEDLFR